MQPLRNSNLRSTGTFSSVNPLADEFENSLRKIARAEKHFADLQREIIEFEQSDPYERVIEPHPDKPDHQVHKIKLTKALPESLTDIVGDIAQNLRNALDNAGYTVAVLAAPNTDPKFAAFPFAGSAAQMANALGRSKDIPQQIQSLFCGFQPYPGGDDLLWALNEICITDKHKIAVPVGAGSVRLGASVRGTGFFDMPDPHVWDSTKNEMVLITFGPGADFDYQLNFRLFVAFGEIKVVGGKEVLGVFYNLGSKVQSILMAIEAEARRIGLIPR